MNLTEIKAIATGAPAHHAKLFACEDVLKLVAIAEAAMAYLPFVPNPEGNGPASISEHGVSSKNLRTSLDGVTR